MSTDLKILRYPDPLLASSCATVMSFGPALKSFADALYETMKTVAGIGITAGHVGHPLRLVIIELPELGGRRDFVNPEILALSDTLMDHEEGSVSMPGAIETVTRPDALTLGYQDLEGRPHRIELKGFAAICMQHEIDQLDGIFWLERLSRLKRDRLIRKWRKQTG